MHSVSPSRLPYVRAGPTLFSLPLRGPIIRLFDRLCDVRAAKCSVTQVPVVTSTRARGEVVIVMAGLREAAYSVSKYCYWTFFCIATHMHLIVWMVVA